MKEEKYQVKLLDTAIDQLKKLEKKERKRIIDKVESVSHDPFKHVKKLIGFNLFRLKIGSYRVIMSIEKEKMVIFVFQVGHRSTIYRNY